MSFIGFGFVSVKMVYNIVAMFFRLCINWHHKAI